MVSPVTYPAPTTSGINANVVGSIKIYKAGARQKKPFNLNLAYTYQKDVSLGVRAYDSAYAPALLNRMAGFEPIAARSASSRDSLDMSTQRAQFQNRLAGKFASSWRSDASLGASLAESRQAWSMISGRLAQLCLFVRKLRRFDFKGAASALGLKGKRSAALLKSGRLRRRSRAFASNYLEFHFGWSPLVGDIHDAMTVLESPIPLGHYKIGSAPPANTTLGSTTGTYYKWLFKHTIRMYGVVGADISVSNPNLHLLSSLGLTNPASVLWEIVPFSFVVDWLYGVGKFLDSYSVYHGISVQNPYHTVVETDSSLSSLYTRQTTWGPYNEIRVLDYSSWTVCVRREATLPQVTLQPVLTPLFEDKWRRAVAAVSLLIQLGIKRG